MFLFITLSIFLAVPAFFAGYWFFNKITEVPERPAELLYHEQPAGRIHLIEGNRYYDSHPDNPLYCNVLNWADGKIGVCLSEVFEAAPHYQPTMIGSVQVLKPEADAGLVCIIIDNEKAAELGLAPVGLLNWAIWINEHQQRMANVQKYQPHKN